jgi:hypothetical protein
MLSVEISMDRRIRRNLELTTLLGFAYSLVEHQPAGELHRSPARCSVIGFQAHVGNTFAFNYELK